MTGHRPDPLRTTASLPRGAVPHATSSCSSGRAPGAQQSTRLTQDLDTSDCLRIYRLPQYLQIASAFTKYLGILTAPHVCQVMLSGIITGAAGGTRRLWSYCLASLYGPADDLSGSYDMTHIPCCTCHCAHLADAYDSCLPLTHMPASS